MANNYLQFSAILDVGKENVEKAREEESYMAFDMVQPEKGE